MRDKTLDELINDCKDTGALKDAIRTLVVQRDTWIEIVNVSECAEIIQDENQDLIALLAGDV